MKREEAIVILDGFKHNPLFNEQHFEALDMAISALSESKGEWIDVTNGRGGHKCSICNDYAPSYQCGVEWLSKFCPNCGADMRTYNGYTVSNEYVDYQDRAGADMRGDNNG